MIECITINESKKIEDETKRKVKDKISNFLTKILKDLSDYEIRIVHK